MTKREGKDGTGGEEACSGLRIFGFQESVRRGTETGEGSDRPARREWGGQETGSENGLRRKLADAIACARERATLHATCSLWRRQKAALAGVAPSILLILLKLLTSNTALFLALELIIEQEKSLLVRLRSTDDGEHPFTSVIMRLLGNRNLGSRQAADFRDFCSVSANDASDHVRGD